MLTLTTVTVLKLVAFYSDLRVRLTGTSVPHAGSVEVLYQGVWGQVDYDPKWNLNNAHVVCRQLGYQAATAAVGGSAFGNGSNPWWLSGVSCKGSETSLRQCTNDGWGVISPFSDRSAAGVVCQQGSDTANGSDLVLRLNGPTIKSAGRVEVQHAGVWGTVAVRTSTSGDVVCRQQGYTGFLHIVTHLRERGVGPSWIQNLACTGAEKRITDCRYQPLNSMITYQPNSYTYLICNDTQNANDFKVRLAGSQEEGRGRVEILYHGVWGTINGRSIDRVTKGAAAVVCRELGYPRAVLSGYGSFGAGSGPVWLNRWRSLECLGNETSLAKCNWKIDKFLFTRGHTSDWFVVCDVPGSTDDSPKTPEDVKWTKLNSRLVCFNARRPQRPQRQITQFRPAIFSPPTTGMVSSFKLVHRRGKVSCDSALGNLTESNWGCANHPNRQYGNGSLNVVITDNRNRLVAPFNPSWTLSRGYWYNLPGFNSNSPNVTMETGRLPFRVEATTPLTVWYGEALRNWDVDNNIGTVCLDIYAQYITTDLQIRLSSSKLSYAGLVEVKYKGVWGTIHLQNTFREGINQKRRRRSIAVRNNPGPDVICRQLNYSGVLIATPFPMFSSGVGPVWYEDSPFSRASLTRCPDDAKNLSQCVAGSQLGLVYSSDHMRDLNVICKPKGLLSKDLEIRLQGSSVQHAGRVEVKYAGVWGGVSRTGWNIGAANVTCRQLGFRGAAEVFNGASFGPKQGPIWVSSVVCSGAEPKLPNCSLKMQTGAVEYFSFAFAFASSDNIAGVLCNPKVKEDAELPLRLRGSSISNAGRVEVFFAGIWGTISSAGWDLLDAHVVCRQLGFVGALSSGTGPSFGYGTGPVWFTNVNCSNQAATGYSFAKCQRTLLGEPRYRFTGSLFRREVANVVCKTTDRTGGGQCSSSTCLSNGTCVDLGEELACDCPPGYAGNRCERDMREACHSDPCYNNGTCYDNKDRFVCLCSEGWAGTHCEKDIKDEDGEPGQPLTQG